LLKVHDEDELQHLKSKWMDYMIDSGISNTQALKVETAVSVAKNLLDNFFQYR